MRHSSRCPDLTTRWDTTTSRCIPCPLKQGQEITPNCGWHDDGGRHEPPTRPCKPGTFNDGSRAYCQACAAACPPGYVTVSPCSSTTDTKCQDPRNQTSPTPAKEPTPSHPVPVSSGISSTIQTTRASRLTPNATAAPLDSVPAHGDALWAAPLAILISISLVALSACVIYRKRKRGQDTVMSYRRSSYINAGFTPLSVPSGNSDLEDVLSPSILSAPLQTVLDNLDVLEELVILLDPEIHGVKNTKHLASHCSFPSPWITYAYSMKDSKSPLKAVLEGVTSKHPDWTVRHLAKLLRHMERNDAIAVLAKLRLSELDV